jgi:hypothetical protein
MKKAIRMATIAVLLIVSLILPVQAGPPAQDSPLGLSTPKLIEVALDNGEIDQDTANLYLAYALGDYEKLPARYRSNAPWDGTLPLLHLQEALKTMKAGSTREKIGVMLSGSCSTSSGSLPNIYNSTHFHIEYGTIGGGLSISSYYNSLETSWSQEITSFGWAVPPVLGSNPPPGDRYHVRIDSLGGGLYGYVSTSGAHAGFVGNNPNTTWNDVDAYATCMVLNRDYAGFPGSPQQALDATTAHEFNHSIQYGYGAITGANTPDDSFVEGGATWMEDEVFDSANDNYNFLWPTFSMCMGAYPTANPYPYWITFRGMTERYGTGTAGAGEQVMQDFWEETSQSPTSNMLSAMNTALVNKGTTLADAYHAYAVAVKFNKTCGGGYVYPYCFEEAAGYVSTAGATSVHGTIATVGSNYSGSIADNYALNWISLPTSGVYTVTLQNTSSGGQLRGSVVCNTGSALNVNALPAVVAPGSSSSLTNFDPASCTSVVAVVTNQSQTAANPSSCTAHSYMLRTDGGGASVSHSIYLPIVMKSPSGGGGVVNGDFESGPTGWVEYSLNGWDLILSVPAFPVTPHSGSWAVWLGGDDDEISYVQQQVTVPAGSPYLAYWHWIGSDDTCGYDFGGVIIDSTVVDVYNLCSSANTGGWVKHVVNLSAYAGQSVSLQIRAETDSSLSSSLLVDDVSFQASASSMQDSPTLFDLKDAISKSGKTIPQKEKGTDTGKLLYP